MTAIDKPQEEQQVEKKIGQLQNQQKILLNRTRSEEHRARTQLIGRGALLEAVRFIECNPLENIARSTTEKTLRPKGD